MTMLRTWSVVFRTALHDVTPFFPPQLPTRTFACSFAFAFNCDQCNYSSTTADRMKLHKRMHTGEKPFSCGQCNFSCKTSNHLRRHVIKKHILPPNVEQGEPMHDLKLIFHVLKLNIDNDEHAEDMDGGLSYCAAQCDPVFPTTTSESYFPPRICIPLIIILPIVPIQLIQILLI